MREGFIPLNDEPLSASLASSRLGSNSDDDMLEADADKQRIPFNVRPVSNKREDEEVDGVEEVKEEEDEELKRWEIQQIYKGVGTKEISKRKDLLEKMGKSPRTSISPGKVGLNFGKRTTVTIDSITKDVKSTLSSLQDANKSHVAQLDRLNKDIEGLNQSVSSLKEELKKGEDEYTFFASMKIYVIDLLNCLGAKAGLVEQAEDKLMAAFRVRTAKNKSHAQAKIDAEIKSMKTLVDEAAGYKHTTNNNNKIDRGSGKLRARGEEEGWSSDEESGDVNKEFAKDRAAAIETGKAVFADVDDQYSAISVIKQKFEKWKFDYPESYKQAYISLSIPQIFSPFVRLQFLNREPLQSGMDKMDWYLELFAFGLHSNTSDGDDEDNFLVPRLIEKVVVPRVHDVLAHIWVPTSKSGNAKALSVVQELLLYADVNAPTVKEMFSAIHIGLVSAVDEAVVPIFPQPKPGESAQPFEVSCRMLWRAVKLMRNIAAWYVFYSKHFYFYLMMLCNIGTK